MDSRLRRFEVELGNEVGRLFATPAYSSIQSYCIPSRALAELPGSRSLFGSIAPNF
jgi:hypothetical protein